MSEPSAPARVPPSSGRGCATAVGLGCGTVVLLGALVVGGATWWALSSPTQVSTAGIAAPTSAGYIEIQDLTEDQHARELLTQLSRRLTEANNRRRSERLPESVRWLQGLQDAQGKSAFIRDVAVPREVTIAFDAAERQIHASAAVNLRSFVRPISMGLRMIADAPATASAGTHRGHPLAVSPRGDAVGFLGGTIVYAGSVDRLRTDMDRLAEAAPARPEGFEQYRAEWSAFGAFDGRVMPLVGETLGLPADSAAHVTAGLLGARFVDADQVRIDSRFDCDSAAAAQGLAAAIAGRVASIEDAYPDSGLGIALAQNVNGTRVQSAITLSHLVESIGAFFDRAAEAGAQPPPQ